MKCWPFYIGLAVTLVYANSLTAPFVFDAKARILENAFIADPALLFAKLSKTRFLGHLSLALNYRLGEFQVAGYHVFNILVHLLASLTLFGFLKRTFQLPAFAERLNAPAILLAGAAALLWAVHPLQTQSVTYVIQRSESLAGLWYFLIFYCVLRAESSQKFKNAWYAGAVFSCYLGCFTKETIATAPIALLVFDRLFLAGTWQSVMEKRKYLYGSLFLSWILIFVLLKWMPEPAVQSAGFSLGEISAFDYLLTQSKVVLHYLKLAFVPVGLSLDYGWPAAGSFFASAPYVVTTAALLGAAVYAVRKFPVYGFFGFWFFILLAPTSSIFPIADLAVEHRMYLPLAGVIVIAVMAVDRFLKYLSGKMPEKITNLIGVWVFLIAALSLGGLTIARNQNYSSEISIWQDTVSKRPANSRARIQLANALYAENRFEEAEKEYAYVIANEFQDKRALAQGYAGTGNILLHRMKYREAVEQYGMALGIDAGFAEAYHNRGLVLANLNNADAAAEDYKKALQINPDYGDAHANYGILLSRLGKTEQAFLHLNKAAALLPRDAVIRYNLASFFARQGGFDEAVAYYRDAIRLNPDFAEAHDNLGTLFASRGELEKAREHHGQAVKLNPRNASYHFNFGNALVMDGKNDDLAIAQYKEAIFYDPKHTGARNNIGATLARQGKMKAAADYFTETLSIDPDNKDALRNLSIIREQSEAAGI